MRQHHIPLEELARLPSFAYVTPSWGRDKVAFYWDKTGRFELYVLDLATRELRQVTNGQIPRQLAAGFVWTRDDRAIIFAKDLGGNEKNDLHRLDLATGEVTPLHEDPNTQEYAIEVSPDNRRLSITSNRAGQVQLFTLDLQTGDWQQLTRFEAPASGGRWSPDGEWLAFGTNESSTLKNLDGYLVRADGSETRKVLSVQEGSRDYISDWHPEAHHLAVFSDASGSYRPGILDLETGKVQWLGQEGVEEYAGSFSEGGEWVTTIRNTEASLMPVIYNVMTGEEQPLQLPFGFAAGTSFVLNDTKLLIELSTATSRNELVLYDIATHTYEPLLPSEYGSIDPTRFIAEHYVKYPSYDGQMVPAIIYTPRDVQPDERLPALVIVHGGPTSQFFRSFDLYAQYLADRGYVVLQPNVRGSTGYGTTWRDANLKDWGGGDLEDVVAGAEYLKSLPYVDPTRIGVFGGSFGGFMAFLAVVKKPDLFKVGIPWVGISDLHLLYQENMEHFRYYLRQQMGDPEVDYALWRDRSAVTHVENVKAKLLIIHGTNDPRCPISQARVFRDRLVALGKREGTDPNDDFEYHEFDEGHGGGGDIEAKIRTYRLMSDFLDRRL